MEAYHSDGDGSTSGGERRIREGSRLGGTDTGFRAETVQGKERRIDTRIANSVSVRPSKR